MSSTSRSSRVVLSDSIECVEEPRPPFLRFESTVYVNGEAVGKGRGKSQRAAQGRASWFALVHLGAIQVCVVC